MLIGKRLLNKYYMTDYSEVYRIAMGMFISLSSSVSVGADMTFTSA